MEELKPGQLVRSLAGRDKGVHYLVLEVVDPRHVLLVNGGPRTMARPKIKNKVHLQRYQRRADIAALVDADKLTDSHIISFIKELAPREEVKQEV